MNNTIDYVKKLLSEGPCVVDFTKKNGENRVMTCTTSETIIPEEKRPKNVSADLQVSKSVRVFDLNKQEWRSFLFENLNSISTSQDLCYNSTI